MRPVAVTLFLALAGCGSVSEHSDGAPPNPDAAHANPDAAQATLTVMLAGGSTGTVTSAPAGIDCGTSCTLSTGLGTVVTLTALPDTGAVFTGWSGGGCSGTSTCDVTLAADTTVTATFDLGSVAIDSGWNCASGISCTDFYDFTLAADTDMTIAVTAVTGNSVLRLSAFAPGVATSGRDLLTGPPSDRLCAAQNANDSVTVRAVTAGTYRLGVGRDWGLSAGASGTYTVTFTASAPMTYDGPTGDDIASAANNTRCGYLFTAPLAWACASGVSCQDVFDFGTIDPTTIRVAVSAVTGASVPRLAVFDGATVDTTNRLNGNLADRMCVGQNVNDSAISAMLPTGNHRIAMGRDWGNSAGAGGTYTVSITTPDVPLIPGGQTLDDTASAFVNTTCP